MTLLHDVARCEGRYSDDRLRACCETCARRTSPPVNEYQVWTMPPEFDGEECPSEIRHESHQMAGI
jgi:hypothetical protein